MKASNYRLPASALATVFLAIFAGTADAQRAEGPFDGFDRDTQRFLHKVCKSSRRCTAKRPADHAAAQELLGKLLALPTLTDGHSRADTVQLRRLDGQPERKLDYALGRAVELMGKTPRARGWDRDRRLDEVADWLAVEYDAGFWSTLPDDLQQYEQAVGSIGQSADHVGVSFNVDVNNSWINGTFLLDVSASVSNGPATHFRMWCDQCDWIGTGNDWLEWSEWNDMLVVVGHGYKNICLQVRAEPVQGNFENMAIDCDELGTPPSPTPPANEQDIAPSNNPVQRCFGAIGNNCGAADGDGFDYGHCVRMHPFSDPDTATCQINAGSWEHDECCIEYRVGGNAPADEQGSCSPPMAAALNQPYVCEAEFDKAVARLGQGLTWTRNVDATIENTTGEVVFSRYCAQAGSILHKNEVGTYCCSGSGEPYVQSIADALADVRYVCL